MRRPGADRRLLVNMDHVWVVVALAVPVISVLAARMSTVDLTYQVRAGRIMLDTHRLLDVDTFTYTAGGTYWLNQQWGAEVLLGAIQRIGGFGALSLARGLLTLATYGFVFLACREAGAQLRRAALLTTVAFVLSLYHLAMRPQMFGIALFAAALFVIEGRRRRPALLWAMPVLIVAWANIHGSFVLGPVLVGLAWLEDVRDKSPVARRTFAVGVASVLATLVNPFGLHVWTYAVGIGTNSTIRNLIVEWKPTTIDSAAGAALFVSAAAFTVYAARREERVPWLTLLRLGIFFFLSLPAIRGALWWGLAAPVILAEILPPSRKSSKVGVPALNLTIAVLVCLVTLLVIPRNGRTAQGLPLLSESPIALSNVVREQLPPGSRLFVSQVWGSWFEYSVPTMPVFVDARIEIYSQSVWDDYFFISGAGDGWQGAIDRWQVDAAVLNASQSGPLIGRMLQSSDWRVAYHDASGYVFVRRTT